MKTAIQLSLLIFLNITFYQSVYCQSSISGRVQDGLQQPLAYANVLLLNAQDSALIQGQVTQENGHFNLVNLAPGRYIINISMIGYLPHYAALQVAGESLDLGIIKIDEHQELLGEVIVQGRKPLYEQKVDRLVVNVASSSVSVGGTAWEVLKRSPGITINDFRGDIVMNGKSGVLILINGKPANVSLEVVLNRLRGMPAGTIERIELLHSPPSKYDAEGTAGAINIVIKENLDEGFNGTLNATASYGNINSGNIALNFNFRKNKINLYGNGHILHGKGKNNYLEHNRSFTIDDTFYWGTNQQNFYRIDQQNRGIQLGFDYELSSKTTLGMVGNAGYSLWGLRSNSKSLITSDALITDQIQMHMHSSIISNNAYANFNVEHTFNKFHKLSFDIDYVFYALSNPGTTNVNYIKSRYNTPQPNKITVTKETPFNIWVAKGDYSWTLPKGQTLELGVKSNFTSFDNSLEVGNFVNKNEPLAPINNARDYVSEITHAAYASLYLPFNKKWNLQGGLRYEYNNYQINTQAESQDYHRESGRFFPTIYLTHTIDSVNKINFSYNRRINRPNYTQLAAYFVYLDPYQIVAGNPLLQPAITDAVSLSYSLKSVIFTIGYSQEKRAILWRNIIDVENQLQLNQQHNFDLYKLASFTVASPLYPAKWWEIQLTSTLEHRIVIDEEGRDFPIHLFKYNILGNMTQTFSLPGKVKLEINGNYTTTALAGEQEYFGRGALDVAIEKAFSGNNNHKLSLALIDVFNSSSLILWDFQQQKYAVRTYGIYQFSQRHVRLSYIQTFGSDKLKNARKRSIGSEEERRRMN